MDKNELAGSFRFTGADYERFRPGFPTEALDLFPLDPAVDVLDLGAGTGKLTRLLRDRARSVFAVDPSATMLEQLRTLLPTVDARLGSAEAIPLDDSCVDVVTVAQAFHWFDQERACAEIARVLRPGGLLVLLWNVAEPTCRWDIACEQIAHPGRDKSSADHSRPPVLNELPGFAGMRSGRVPWHEQLSRADYLRRWQTVSSLLVADAATRDDRLSRMVGVLDADAETAGASVVDLKQVTEVLVYTRRG